MQPGGKCRFAPERGNLAEELQERLLRQIFGFRSIADHAQTERIDPPLVQRIERFKRSCVTSFGTFNRLCFAQPGNQCFFSLCQIAFSGRVSSDAAKYLIRCLSVTDAANPADGANAAVGTICGCLLLKRAGSANFCQLNDNDSHRDENSAALVA